ncbi:TetR family transcriptional regulator [Sphingomonas sp. ASV193]|uniref:TetR/AcrR family transcriptional regulator n=1 Tax=Sphingomonas sp. ASV193 TaxID=3144405 RepID=UPI0032E8ECC0
MKCDRAKRRGAADTQAAILVAARKSFAERGFDRTTIRLVAAEAGCDPALVMRYFGSKRGLFFQAVEVELERMPDAQPGSPVDLVAAAENLLESWHRDRTFISVIRSAASNEDAADMMRDFFEQRVRKHQARVFGLPPDQAVCFGAMLLGIAFAREICRVPPIASMSSRALAELVGQLVTGGSRVPA